MEKEGNRPKGEEGGWRGLIDIPLLMRGNPWQPLISFGC